MRRLKGFIRFDVLMVVMMVAVFVLGATQSGKIFRAQRIGHTMDAKLAMARGLVESS